MSGDPTLFMRADMVEQTWRIVQPVLEAWSGDGAADMAAYASGSSGPDQASALLSRENRQWRPSNPTRGETHDGAKKNLRRGLRRGRLAGHRRQATHAGGNPRGDAPARRRPRLHPHQQPSPARPARTRRGARRRGAGRRLQRRRDRRPRSRPACRTHPRPADRAKERSIFYTRETWKPGCSADRTGWRATCPAAYVAHERRTVQFAPTPVESFDAALATSAKIVAVSPDFSALDACEAQMRESLGDEANVVRSRTIISTSPIPAPTRATASRNSRG